MDAIAGDSRLLTEHVARIDSTNSELLRREPLVPPGSAATAVWLVADVQTGGRGRRQRTWKSAPAGSLTASLGYEVRQPGSLGALPLAAGVAVAEALAGFGVAVRLKWPNDLHVAGGKAGGILCEARARGPATRVVIGCGLNLLAPDPGVDLGQPAAGLFDPPALPDLGRLSAAVGRALLAASAQLHEQGFEGFRQRWDARDLLRSRPILIHDYDGVHAAVAEGIDRDGALLVADDDRPGQLRRLLAEEVSVRPLSP
jgi:BirA family biotin operon repressor/biotin-[acetyl-CoA-carboxylase] ligase